jgi:hypothetical protein
MHLHLFQLAIKMTPNVFAAIETRQKNKCQLESKMELEGRLKTVAQALHHSWYIQKALFFDSAFFIQEPVYPIEYNNQYK